jgi:hypothetical protein
MSRSPSRSPTFTPQQNARTRSRRTVILASFLVAFICLLAVPHQVGLNLVFKITGLLAVLVFFLSLFYRPVHTDQALYHRVYGIFRNRFVKLHGSDLGGWRPLAIWYSIESKPHMQAKTITLSGSDINDLRDHNQLPMNFMGVLTVKVYPDRADFPYQVEVAKCPTSDDAIALFRATAAVTVRKALRDMLLQSQDALNVQLEQQNIQINIEDTLFKTFDNNTYGLVIDRKLSSLDKGYNKQVEAEIVRAYAARQGFETLMKGDFSLANFSRVRASFNSSMRFRETNMTREPRDSSLAQRRTDTHAAASSANARTTEQHQAVAPEPHVPAQVTHPSEPVTSYESQGADRQAPPEPEPEISKEEKRLRESIERLQRRSNSD